MYYVMKSALLLTLLYGGFLERETFHRLNRVMLLGIMLISLILPAIHVTTESKTPITLEQYFPEEPVAMEPNHVDWALDALDKAGNQGPVPVIQPSTVHSPLSTINCQLFYLIGVIFVLTRLAYYLVILTLNFRGKFRVKDGQGNTVIVRGGQFAPFSFMHFIVISVSDYEQYRQYILSHEQAHVRLGHSWDVLLLQLVQAFQWFNPFVWLLGRELRAVHEYEADEAVIQQGIDAKTYQQLLVIKAVGNRLQPFANTLNRGSLKQRINMMYQKKSNRWRMLRAAFVIPVTAVALIAFATPESTTPVMPQSVVKTDHTGTKPLVEYRAHDKVGKTYRDYYLVHLGEGVWVENDGKSYIEEQYFSYSFDNTRNKPVMMLNGVPFDQNSLPKLTCNDLKKIEIRNAGHKMLVEGEAHGNHLNIDGETMTINLVTTPVTIPSSVQGNVPRVQTLLLPGNGELYIKNGKATPGDWLHTSVTSWEKTPWGTSVRTEMEKSVKKPGYKCYIYASTETAQKDIARAEALMKEIGISNYEIVRDLPKKHFTDSELRQWAKAQKSKGIAYDKLFDQMAPEHMDCADVHRQWHIVKAVYGRK